RFLHSSGLGRKPADEPGHNDARRDEMRCLSHLSLPSLPSRGAPCLRSRWKPSTTISIRIGSESGMAAFYACFRAFLVLTRVFRLLTRGGGKRDGEDNTAGSWCS